MKPCGKKTHASRQQAKTAPTKCIANGRAERRFYYCKACEGYHLTSQT